MKITVVDYGAGNLKSITNMLENLGCEYILTDNPDEILKAERIIFPGQGHFEQAMKMLNKKGLADCIKKSVEKGIPFLGICLGLQILFEESEEAPGVKGLSILKGKVKKFTEGKIPQIGWNRLKITKNNTFLTNDYYYFVNSYYVKPDDKWIVSAYANYHMDFAAAVEYKNLVAMQFHPEKSGEIGYITLQKWLNYKAN
ncbi:MAG: imidazole glycerol phosphate synthase subunit HisH [Candidatus Gastranaerophilales bacterium]|nr:imidazole glycerol phosphate synthase subunit HisH [Candidatus Gastranaerophilales bacterium]